MLLVVQFPIADFRRIEANPTGERLLGRPGWPAPWPDEEFVRSFGPVRERPRGGVANWIGEQVVCDAPRALRFVNLRSTRSEQLHSAFRRFYFDGRAVAKFEVGIRARPSRPIDSPEAARRLLHHLLSVEVGIPNPDGGRVVVPLASAGKGLASLYRFSSTAFGTQEERSADLVQAGTPLVLLLRHRPDHEMVVAPFPNGGILRGEDFSVWRYRIPMPGGRSLGLWDFELHERASNGSPQRSARLTRIALLRMHAERICLQLALQQIRSGRLVYARGTPASDRLQRYLLDTLRRLRREEQMAENSLTVEREVLERAKHLEDLAAPGYREQVIQAVRQLDIRPNIEAGLLDYVEERGLAVNFYATHNEVMGDQITIGDITGSIVNIKSLLRDAQQTIDGAVVTQANGLDESRQAELKRLLAELDSALVEVSNARPRDATRIAEAAKTVVDEAVQEEPHRGFLRTSAEGLKQAAEAVAAIAPTVLVVAKKIADFVVSIA